MTLLICETCPRYDTRHYGEFARTFHEALREVAVEQSELRDAIRAVLCMGGCPADVVVALDAPGKARVRFSGLNHTHAAAVAEAAASYHDALDGHPDHWTVPESLRGHVTAKRFPVR